MVVYNQLPKPERILTQGEEVQKAHMDPISDPQRYIACAGSWTRKRIERWNALHEAVMRPIKQSLPLLGSTG